MRGCAAYTVFSVLTVVIFASVGRTSASVSTEKELEETLIARGFENVAVRRAESRLTVWCENRAVRFTVEWIVEALAVVSGQVAPETQVRIVAQRHARPIVELTARAGDVVEWLSYRLTTREFDKRIVVRYAGSEKPPETRNRSVLRTDLELGPGWILAEANLPDERFARISFDVRATFRSTIANGVFGTGQAYVPVYNYQGPVGGDRRLREVRPGTMAMGVIQPLGGSSFAVATLGYFDYGSRVYDSYGFVLDVRHFSPDGRWHAGVHTGYLGQGSYVIDVEGGEVVRAWDIRYPMHRKPYFAVVGYRFSEVDLRLDLRWGRFLLGDRGWRVDIERKFGEAGVTVFGLRTDAKMHGSQRPPANRDRRLLGGIRLEILLPPRHRSEPAAVRVTAAPSFKWQLRYRTGQIGAGLPLDYWVEGMIGEYNPMVVRNSLERARVRVAGRVGQ